MCVGSLRTTYNTYRFYAVKSVGSYALTLAKFISFVHRVHLNRVLSYTVPLTSEQHRACEHLVKSFQEKLPLEVQATRLHDLLWVIVSAQRPSYGLDMQYTPFMPFTMFLALDKNGQFALASDIGHNNAQLIYAARATVFYHVHLQCKSDEESSFLP